MSLKNKTLFISGASRGIGLAIATDLRPYHMQPGDEALETDLFMPDWSCPASVDGVLTPEHFITSATA